MIIAVDFVLVAERRSRLSIFTIIGHQPRCSKTFATSIHVLIEILFIIQPAENYSSTSIDVMRRRHRRYATIGLLLDCSRSYNHQNPTRVDFYELYDTSYEYTLHDYGSVVTRDHDESIRIQ